MGVTKVRGRCFLPMQLLCSPTSESQPTQQNFQSLPGLLHTRKNIDTGQGPIPPVLNPRVPLQVGDEVTLQLAQKIYFISSRSFVPKFVRTDLPYRRRKRTKILSEVLYFLFLTNVRRIRSQGSQRVLFVCRSHLNQRVREERVVLTGTVTGNRYQEVGTRYGHHQKHQSTRRVGKDGYVYVTEIEKSVTVCSGRSDSL